MAQKLQFNILVTPKSTKMLGSIAIVAFIVLHIVMMAIFARYGVVPMVAFDMFSIGVYLISIVLLQKEYWRTFALVVYTQTFVHTALAVLCVGWGANFQITIIAMNVLGFYSEYAARTMRIKTLHAMNFSVAGLLLYVALLVFTSQVDPPYYLPGHVMLASQLLWGIATIVLVAGYLQLFMTIALNSTDAMEDKANHDSLTGLPNRTYMTDHLAQLMQDGGFDGHWAAMFDIDDFKLINDTYGHNCGDSVLRDMAGLLRDASESNQLPLCRWGGEEFLMVGRCDAGDSHLRMLERLRGTIEEHGFWYKDVRLNVTMTIGVAAYEPGQSAVEWVNAADKKLYEGKCNGKNQVVA